MVTSVLASYRGFDTLGETVVVFSAAIGVISLLGVRRLKKDEVPESGLIAHRVLRSVAKIIIPLIILFALYVQFHGDFGPGGGFQAGVIAAAALILYALVFGLPLALAVIGPRFLMLLAPFEIFSDSATGLG